MSLQTRLASLISAIGADIKSIQDELASLSGGGGIQIDEFTVSGTWNKPSGAKRVYIHCIAGGEGGSATSTSGGGDGGHAFVAEYSADSLPSSVSVTVGSGGLGGVRTSPFASTAPTAGGETSFGTYVDTSDIVAVDVGGDYVYNVPEMWLGGGVSWTTNAPANTDATYGGAKGGNAGASGYTSVDGGDGGAGGFTGADGQVGGGGGGAGNNTDGSTGGDGGSGLVRVVTYF